MQYVAFLSPLWLYPLLPVLPLGVSLIGNETKRQGGNLHFGGAVHDSAHVARDCCAYMFATNSLKVSSRASGAG